MLQADGAPAAQDTAEPIFLCLPRNVPFPPRHRSPQDAACDCTACSAVFTMLVSNLQSIQLCAAAAAADMLHPMYLWTLCQRHTVQTSCDTSYCPCKQSRKVCAPIQISWPLPPHQHAHSCFTDPASRSAHVLRVAIHRAVKYHRCLLSSSKLLQSGCEMRSCVRLQHSARLC